MFSALDLRNLIDLLSPSMHRQPSALRDYMEQQSYGRLLNENARLDFIIKTYGAKLEAKWQASKAEEPAAVQAAVEALPGESDQQKLIAYFMSIDPTPNKEFTQWMVQRYLKGEFRLEDGQVAHDEVLPDFLTMRRNLPPDQRDINRFRTLGDLRAAMRATQVEDIPAADPVLDAKMHKQADVIYNGPDVKIVVPKTVEASCYFGKGTDWCTAKYGPDDSRGMYNHYTRSGPLYIIYDKKTRKRVQFHFSSRQFMDEQDRQIDLDAYLREHPSVFKAIGEKAFLPIANKLGLQWFGPEYVKQIPLDQLIQMVRSPADLRLVPPETQKEYDFVGSLLHVRPQAVQWLPREGYQEHLDDIVYDVPKVFRFLAPELQNAKLAEIAASRSRSWEDIEQNVPEQWMTPQVRTRMWELRLVNDQRLHLQDVPEEFRSPLVIEMTLSRFPDDIPANLGAITRNIAYAIAERNVEAIKQLPVQFLDKKMAQIIEHKVDNSPGKDDYFLRPYAQLLRFPTKYWTEAATKYLLRQHDFKLPFTRLPKQYQNPELAYLYVYSNPKLARTVPDEFMTADVLMKLIDRSYHRDELLKSLNPRLLTDELFAQVVKKYSEQQDEDIGHYGSPSYYATEFYKHIPPQLRRPDVRRMFMALHAVPVKEMVPNEITEEKLVKRVGAHPEETKNIPPAFWTPEFAVKLVDRNIDTMPGVPDAMLSEPLLWTYIDPAKHAMPHYDPHRGSYGNELRAKFGNQVKRFPPNLWSARTYAAAIEQRLLPKTATVPPELMNNDIAGAILANDPARIAELPPQVVDDHALGKAVKKNLHLLKVLRPEQITEPVAYEAMHSWAGSLRPERWGMSPSQQADRKLLLDIPREVWSKRVYTDAVGNLMDLKEVPGKFRSTELVKKAIERDPANVRFIKDPAAFMNAHVPAANRNDEWKEKLEANGVIPMKKGTYVNIKDMEKKPLPSGFQVGMLPLGSVNRRLYLFDPKGQFVCYLYTNKRKVFFPDARKYIKYQKPLAELAREYLGGFEAWQLNDAGVYAYHNNYFTEEGAHRNKDGVFEWSRNSHIEGEMYVAWYNNKQMIRVYTEYSKPAFGGRRNGVNRVQSLKVHDWPLVLAHVPDVFHYVDKTMHLTDDYHWLPFGIVASRSGAVELVGQMVAQSGDLSVKRGERYVGLFGPKGMLAYGTLRKNGNIDHIHQVYQYEGRDVSSGAIEVMFDKVADYLRKQAKGTAEPLDLSKSESAS